MVKGVRKKLFVVVCSIMLLIFLSSLIIIPVYFFNTFIPSVLIENNLEQVCLIENAGKNWKN